MSLNILSLFSGIGGLELGLERAGMTVVGQVEIDPYCRRVLAKHWPEVPRHDDVRTCVEWWRREPRPVVDLVCGGFPCQPVSVAGQRLAQADPRWLWPAYHAVIRALRPRWVLVENVPGLLAAGMGDVLGDLAGIGYDAEWDRVPAAFVGAPHIRGRIFVVAYPNSQRKLQPSGSIANLRRRTGDRSMAAHVADTDSLTGRPRRSSNPQQSPRRRDADRSSISPANMADTDIGRWDRRPRIFGTGRRGQPTNGRRWPAEPNVGRVAHGVPSGMDRRRVIGNAVVPQVAQHVGQLILAADAKRGAT